MRGLLVLFLFCVPTVSAVASDDPAGDLRLGVKGVPVPPMDHSHSELDFTRLEAQRTPEHLAFTVDVRDLRPNAGTWAENGRIDVHFTVEGQEHRVRLMLIWCVFCTVQGLTGSADLERLTSGTWYHVEDLRADLDPERDRFHLEVPWDDLSVPASVPVERIFALGVDDGDDSLWATRWYLGEGQLPVRIWDRVPDVGSLRLEAPQENEASIGPDPQDDLEPQERPQPPQEPPQSQEGDEADADGPEPRARSVPGPDPALLLVALAAVLLRRR